MLNHGHLIKVTDGFIKKCKTHSNIANRVAKKPSRKNMFLRIVYCVKLSYLEKTELTQQTM
jgi:hypothetical protein